MCSWQWQEAAFQSCVRGQGRTSRGHADDKSRNLWSPWAPLSSRWEPAGQERQTPGEGGPDSLDPCEDRGAHKTPVRGSDSLEPACLLPTFLLQSFFSITFFFLSVAKTPARFIPLQRDFFNALGALYFL